jgi:hypothetical protein
MDLQYRSDDVSITKANIAETKSLIRSVRIKIPKQISRLEGVDKMPTLRGSFSLPGEQKSAPEGDAVLGVHH